MNLETVLIISAILILLYAQIRKFIFKNKDARLVTDDSNLKTKQEVLQVKVAELKSHIKAEDLSPEEIEVYWSKNEKK